MVFSSNTFLFFFLPICLSGYYLLRDKYKNIWLFFMSLLFYGWSSIKFLPIIGISIVLNYTGGYLINYTEKYPNKRIKKILCFLVISINILFLGYWKYLNFFVDSLRSIVGMDLTIEKITLPVGISFFTFQGISYVIDVYRKQVPVQKQIINVGLYIALFPQLIAGPIVRYSDINQEIIYRKHSPKMFAEGIRRFTVGLAKKSILANTLAVNADAIFSIPYYQNTTIVAWIGAVCYSLQIYFDFSGYSDMAIGLGKMFGFHILENFNYPYISGTVREFWRRWHISLGNWMRDYLYIPLGGNRKGKVRKIINTFVVFGISGLWHGANWTFVLWGIFYGILIVSSLLTEDYVLKFNKKHKFTKAGMFHIFRIARTNLLVMIGWVFFKADNIGAAFGYIKSMFGLVKVKQNGFTWQWYLTKYHIFILITGLIAMLPQAKQAFYILKEKINEKTFTIVCNIGTIFLLILSIMYVMTSTYNPFIYFQF